MRNDRSPFLLGIIETEPIALDKRISVGSRAVQAKGIQSLFSQEFYKIAFFATANIQDGLLYLIQVNVQELQLKTWRIFCTRNSL